LTEGARSAGSGAIGGGENLRRGVREGSLVGEDEFSAEPLRGNSDAIDTSADSTC